MLIFNLFGFIFYAAVGSTQIAFYTSEERPPTVRGCRGVHIKCQMILSGQAHGLLNGCDVDPYKFHLFSRCDMVCTRCFEKINKRKEKKFIYIIMQYHG